LLVTIQPLTGQNGDMATDFSEKLLQHHIPFRLVLFKGGDHRILEYRDEVDQMVVEWFDR